MMGDTAIGWFAERYESQPRLPMTGNLVIGWYTLAGHHEFQHRMLDADSISLPRIPITGSSLAILVGICLLGTIRPCTTC